MCIAINIREELTRTRDYCEHESRQAPGWRAIAGETEIPPPR
jgi:hypothetical protein